MDCELRHELDASICNELERMIVRVSEGEWLDSEAADRIARSMSAAKDRLHQLVS